MAESTGILDIHEDEVNNMVKSSSSSVITLTGRVKPYTASPAGYSVVVLSSGPQ